MWRSTHRRSLAARADSYGLAADPVRGRCILDTPHPHLILSHLVISTIDRHRHRHCHRRSDTWTHPASSIQHPASSIQHPTNNTSLNKQQPTTPSVAHPHLHIQRCLNAVSLPLFPSHQLPAFPASLPSPSPLPPSINPRTPPYTHTPITYLQAPSSKRQKSKNKRNGPRTQVRALQQVWAYSRMSYRYWPGGLAGDLDALTLAAHAYLPRPGSRRLEEPAYLLSATSSTPRSVSDHRSGPSFSLPGLVSSFSICLPFAFSLPTARLLLTRIMITLLR